VSELCSSHLVSELCFSDPGLWPVLYQTLSDPAFSQPHRFRVSLRKLVFDHQSSLWPSRKKKKKKIKIKKNKNKKKKSALQKFY
jgi:hypothetical protein